eukprot:11234587-Alexandrium_andersonii.AAC.1
MREWLKLVKEYERRRPQPIPDDVKVATLQARRAGKLKDHLQLNAPAYNTLGQLVAFIENYFDSQRAYRPADLSKPPT